MSALLAGQKMLVIEDEYLVALYLEDLLREEGADVTCAATLQDALGHAESSEITCAIVDHRLGSDDTTDVCAKLRARGVPFIVYSGWPIDQPDGGVSLVKPTTREALLMAIRTLLALP